MVSASRMNIAGLKLNVNDLAKRDHPQVASQTLALTLLIKS